MKKMISLKVTPGVELLLKKLASKNKRSQGAQVEFMVEEECKKQGIK